MRTRWLPLLLALGASLLVPSSARAQFALADGERLVFLGSTLIEREQLFGYWETMLVTHFPERKIAVRNFARSGDTVGAKSLERLKEQIEAIGPTVVFVAYGTDESSADEPGLPRFRQELDALFDMLAAAGKPRVVLMAPLKVEVMGPPQPDPEVRNRELWHYTDLMHEIAVGRDDTFLDLNRWLESLRQAQAGKRPFWTDDGTQLNRLGYWLTAAALENDLLLRPSGWNLKLDASGKVLESSGAKLQHVQAAGDGFAGEFRSSSLPLTAALRESAHSGQLRISGLPAGRHTLRIDGHELVELDADEWERGIALDMPAELTQLESLRRAIVRKNEFYLRRDHPAAAERLFGPRKEGEGADGAPQEKLLAEHEASIARLRVPALHKFELVSAVEPAN